MTTPQTHETFPELLAQIQANTATRIIQADKEAEESDLAFAAGRFGEYFDKTCKDLERRIDDEANEILGPPPNGGNSEEGSGVRGWGSSSSEGVSVDEDAG
jgi:hypothetical protein